MRRRGFLQSLAAITLAAYVEVSGALPIPQSINILRENFIQSVVNLWEENDIARFYGKPTKPLSALLASSTPEHTQG